MILSAFAFAVMGVCVQICEKSLPNTMVVFFRNASGLVFLSPIIFRSGPAAFQTRHLKEHVVRGFAGLAAMYCFFHAIAHMPLADAVLLNYTLPLFIPIVERLWLAEPLQPRLAVPLGVGFLGVVVVLRPGSGLVNPAALIGLLAGLLAALAQTSVRKLTLTEPILRIVVYFALMGTLISAVTLPFAWVTPARELWPVLVLLGLSATVGQLLLTKAYSYAPASQIGGFVYSGVLFAALMDWMRLGLVPTIYFFVGALLIVASGALMFRMVSRTKVPVLLDSE